MSLLTVILVLAMLLWSVGFVVVGLVLAEEVLWRRPGTATPPVSRMRRIGALGLLAIGGILVVTTLVAGGLMAEREARFVQLESRLAALKHKVGQEWAGPPHPPADAR